MAWCGGLRRVAAFLLDGQETGKVDALRGILAGLYLGVGKGGLSDEGKKKAAHLFASETGRMRTHERLFILG